jgi:integrase
VVDRAWTHGELKPTKTYQRHTVEIMAPLAADLDMLRPGDTARDDLVCPNRNGGLLDINNWRPRVWTLAERGAGVGWSRPYIGRHTYASVLIHTGRSPLAVAAALGHTSAETTWKHYAHCFDKARLASATDPETSIWEAREAVLMEAGFRAVLRKLES